MNLARTFSFQGHNVRTVVIDGEPWFVAADVCRILGIGDHNQAVYGNSKRVGSGLDDDERALCNVPTPSGDQQMLVISEPGLYTLILRSRKVEAKLFKRWITHDVLPSIRRTGVYWLEMGQPDLVAGASAIQGELAYLREALAEVMRDREVARLEAQSLPEPQGVLPELTPKDQLANAASVLSRISFVPMNAVWALIWREFNQRFHVRIEIQKKNAKWRGTTLGYAVHKGWSDRVYAVIHSLIHQHGGGA